MSRVMIFFVMLPVALKFWHLLIFQQIIVDAQRLDKNIGLPLMDTVTSKVPKVSSEPDSVDHTAEYVGRIANLKGRLNSLKKQTTIATGQAKKSVVLSQKVSLLEDQVSTLTTKIVHLKECDLYMIEVIEAVSGQLSCKLSGAPIFVLLLCCVVLMFFRLGICLDPAAKNR
jgi:hypothetical protein